MLPDIFMGLSIGLAIWLTTYILNRSWLVFKALIS